MSGVFVPWVPLRTGEVGSRDSWWRDSFFANIGVFWVPYIHDTLGLGYLSSNNHKPRWVLFSKHRNFCFNESSLFTWFFLGKGELAVFFEGFGDRRCCAGSLQHHLSRTQHGKNSIQLSLFRLYTGLFYIPYLYRVCFILPFHPKKTWLSNQYHRISLILATCVCFCLVSRFHPYSRGKRQCIALWKGINQCWSGIVDGRTPRGCIKSCKKWEQTTNLNWCRISAINSGNQHLCHLGENFPRKNIYAWLSGGDHQETSEGRWKRRAFHGASG